MKGTQAWKDRPVERVGELCLMLRFLGGDEYEEFWLILVGREEGDLLANWSGSEDFLIENVRTGSDLLVPDFPGFAKYRYDYRSGHP